MPTKSTIVVTTITVMMNLVTLIALTSFQEAWNLTAPSLRLRHYALIISYYFQIAKLFSRRKKFFFAFFCVIILKKLEGGICQMQLVEKIFSTVELGLKIFLFWIVIFFILRLSYIFFLREFLIDTTAQEIFTAIFFGTRLSLQTAGIFALIILIANLLSKKIFKVISAGLIFATIILHFASIPFYQTFHSNFNQMIFAGFALFVTFLQEFNLLPKLFVAVILSAVIYKIFHKINYKNFTGGNLQKIFLALATIFLANVCFYGGGLGWQTELNFENIGVTKNNLLNESILDSFQAIHRARVLQNRIVNSQGLNFTAEQIKNLSQKVTGKNIDSDNIDDYLKKSDKFL